jgi:hypothetical protein
LNPVEYANRPGKPAFRRGRSVPVPSFYDLARRKTSISEFGAPPAAALTEY